MRPLFSLHIILIIILTAKMHFFFSVLKVVIDLKLENPEILLNSYKNILYQNFYLEQIKLPTLHII